VTLPNQDETIPYLTSSKMNPGPLWLQFEARRSRSHWPRTCEEETDGEADEVPSSLASITRVETEDDEEGCEEEQGDEEEETDARSPLTLAELDLSSVHENVIAEIVGLGGFRSYDDRVERITRVMRRRGICFRIIGSVFHLTKGALSQVYKRALNHRNSRGRPALLTGAQMQFLEMFVRDRFSQRAPVTYSELLHELELEFGVVLLEDTMRHIVRRIPGCKTVKGVPQEASRVTYDVQEVENYYEMLESMITGAPGAIVSNVDEVGFESWVDAKRMAVVVPADYVGSEIAVPVDRNDARASMIACVAANSRHLKPDIVVPRKTLETELYESGFPPEVCCVVHQENGYVTALLFEDWLEKVLIPDAISQRERLRWEGPVFLILDGFRGHLTDGVEERCLFYGIELLTIPAQTSDQVQPLDLGIFAVHKMESRRVRPHLGLNGQTSKLIKMISGFQKAATGANVIGALRRAAIVSKWDAEHRELVWIVDRACASEVRHWAQSKKRVVLDSFSGAT
jgi:hypothetical protein